MSAIAFDTMGYFPLFVLFLVVTILFVANPETRAKIMETGQYVLDRIKCILGFECYGTEDDTTAVDSTKALACAIDATAYWSDTTDPKRAAALKVRLEDIKNPDAPKGLFDDIAGERISSCTGETKAPEPPAAPTSKAIGARFGSILAKLSEWSGGGNGVTGNAVGNSITGYGFWGWVVDKFDNLDGTEKCTQLDEKGKTRPTCASASGPENAHSCTSTDKSITCCEEGLSSNTYCCNDGYTPDKKGGCQKLDPGQIKAEAVERANDVLRNNKGKAMTFGQTSVVCGKGEDIKKQVTTTSYMYSDNCGQYNSESSMGQYGVEEPDKTKCGTASGGFQYVGGGTGKCCKVTLTAFSNTPSLSCQVKAFELPQYVKGDIMDYVAKWVGVFGEPKYLVYHETFPIGIEAVWTYSWEDSIISAAAVGGLFNLGGGALKSAWAGIKATSKGMAIAVVKREGFGAAISAGKTAAAEHLGLEYGGEVAAKKILARQFSSSFHGLPQIENIMFKNMEGAILRESSEAGTDSVLKIVHSTLGTDAMRTKFMADMSLIARSSDDVPRDVLKKMLDDSNVKNTMKSLKGWSDEVYEENVGKMSVELRRVNNKWKEGTLLKDDEKAALKKAIDGDVIGDEAVVGAAGKSTAMKALVSQSAKDGLWYFKGLRAFLNTKGYQEQVAKQVKLEAEELAKMTYDDVLKTTYDISRLQGQEAAEKYIKDVYITAYDDLSLAKIPDNFKDAVWAKDTGGAVSALTSDASGLLKGLSGQKRGEGLISLSYQRQVMAVTLAISYLAQKKDANMEKYKSCGQGKLCLHIPKWFLLQREFFSDKGSTQSYGDGTDVKKSFNDLVSLAGFKDEKGQVSGATLRLNLASPCKADIQVKAGEGDNACKCETFYNQSVIWFKLQKNFCKVNTGDKINPYAVYSLPDGTCPAEVKGKLSSRDEEKTFEVTTEAEKDSEAIFPCEITKKENILEDLEFCGRDRIYDKSCLASKKGIPEAPSDERRKKLLSASLNDLKECVPAYLRECSYNTPTDEYCWGFNCDAVTYEKKLIGIKSKVPGSSFAFAKVCNGGEITTDIETSPFPLLLDYDQEKYSGSEDAKQNLDTVVVPLNLLPNVDSGKPAETIAVCENSWVSTFLTKFGGDEEYQRKCITVTPDAGSMKTYSESGFGTNFCAKSDISAMAKAESACFWATIAVSFGAEMASMGAATPVVLYAVGSSGAVCEKLTQMQQKWPNNQF